MENEANRVTSCALTRLPPPRISCRSVESTPPLLPPCASSEFLSLSLCGLVILTLVGCDRQPAASSSQQAAATSQSTAKTTDQQPVGGHAPDSSVAKEPKLTSKAPVLSAAQREAYGRLEVIWEATQISPTRDIREGLFKNLFFTSGNYVKTYPDDQSGWMMRLEACLELFKLNEGIDAEMAMKRLPVYKPDLPRFLNLCERLQWLREEQIATANQAVAKAARKAAADAVVTFKSKPASKDRRRVRHPSKRLGWRASHDSLLAP